MSKFEFVVRGSLATSSINSTSYIFFNFFSINLLFEKCFKHQNCQIFGIFDTVFFAYTVFLSIYNHLAHQSVTVPETSVIVPQQIL